MIVVDGSNALPVLGADRLDDEARRKLITAVAAFARARRTKAVVVFDGSPTSSFATSLGHVTVRFSGAGSGDDLIVSIVDARRAHWIVVTRDAGLRARLRGRRVSFEEPTLLASVQAEEGEGRADDWESWFSDPSNRIS